MRKLIEARVKMENQAIKDIHEVLDNTGKLALTKQPRTNQVTKDVITVLKNHGLIDVEDDSVKILITIQS